MSLTGLIKSVAVRAFQPNVRPTPSSLPRATHQPLVITRANSSAPIRDTGPEPQTLGHTPVLKEELLEVLKVNDGQVFIDATFGYGGYTRSILDSKPTCKVVAIDRDPFAYVRAHEMALRPAYRGRLVPLLGRFGDILALLENFKSRSQLNGSIYLPSGQWIPDRFDGLVMDIGISGGQLDDAARGFSFLLDGPLDMRMCQMDLHNPPPELQTLPEVDWALQRQLYSSKNISAHDVVNPYGMHHLRDILQKFGEERFATRIAQAIIEARCNGLIETTTQLADIVSAVSPRHQRPNSLFGSLYAHPATRTFQGQVYLPNAPFPLFTLRMFVNKEVAELSRLLAISPTLVRRGGVLAAVTCHPLEDRHVKNFLSRGVEAMSKLALGNERNARDQTMKRTRRRRYREKLDLLNTEPTLYKDVAREDPQLSSEEFEHEREADPTDITPEVSYEPGWESAHEPHYEFKVEASLNLLHDASQELNDLPFAIPKPKSAGLIKPSEGEVRENPRAAPAKLRWGIRT
ncbi:hypothetical protein L0F63_005316 [Massospora cicadina]|nr:hypothetical protein L0F63_005316 [Massospora cicadina]